VFAQMVEFRRVAGRLDAGAGFQHHALRAARRAGGVEEHRNFLAIRGLDEIRPGRGAAGIGLHGLAADFLNLGEFAQMRVIVIAQAARLVIDHVLELRYLVRKGQDLVDLFLVLYDGETDAGMVQHIGHFLGHGIGIDRNRDRLQRLNGAERPVEAGSIGADDGYLVSLSYADFMQADRKRADFLELFLPGPALPDPEILVACCRAVGETACVQQQILRKSHRLTAGIAARRWHSPDSPPKPGGASIRRRGANASSFFAQ
ncbi:MAG: hypothetical protein MI923_11175, partial [Phycisphaerales bacterium]|nr:hypothetical protein [Phycisphaerales bacterium]